MKGILKQGQVIKSYRAMCNLLDEPIKNGGDSKQAQLKEWARYFKWHNEKYKFIIDEIYDEPLPKIDGRVNNGGNNTKYEDLFDKIIINRLLDYGGDITASYKDLVNDIFCFFTGEYDRMYSQGWESYADYINISNSQLVKTYQQKMTNVVKGALNTSLNRMQNQGIITYSIETNIKKDYKEYFADEKLKKEIEDAEEEVYKELKMTQGDRMHPQKNRRFKRKVCNIIDVYSYYKVYDIHLVDKNIDKVDEDFEELKDKFIKSLTENVINTTKKGKSYKFYNNAKSKMHINKLTRLLWDLSEDYKTDYEIEQEMRKLFGASDFDDDSDLDIEIDNTNIELDSEDIFINNLNDYIFDESNIPF